MDCQAHCIQGVHTVAGDGDRACNPLFMAGTFPGEKVSNFM